MSILAIIIRDRSGNMTVFCKKGAIKGLSAKDQISDKDTLYIAGTRLRGDQAAMFKIRAYYVEQTGARPDSDTVMIKWFIDQLTQHNVVSFDLSNRDRSFFDRYLRLVEEKCKSFLVSPEFILGLASESGFADDNPNISSTYHTTKDAFGLTGGSTKHMTTASGPSQNVDQLFQLYGDQIRSTANNEESFLDGLQGINAQGKRMPGWRNYNSANKDWRSERKQGIGHVRLKLPVYKFIKSQY